MPPAVIARERFRVVLAADLAVRRGLDLDDLARFCGAGIEDKQAVVVGQHQIAALGPCDRLDGRAIGQGDVVGQGQRRGLREADDKQGEDQ